VFVVVEIMCVLADLSNCLFNSVLGFLEQLFTLLPQFGGLEFFFACFDHLEKAATVAATAPRNKAREPFLTC
jgi:hypothetical protein